MKKNQWKLRDILMMSILGVLFAAVYLAVFSGGMVLSALLTPTGLSTFSFELIYGVWFMASAVAAYIIRKPGAALTTEVLAAGVELLMGNAGGLVVILTGFIQGLGCELGFAAFRYKKFNLLSMTLGGILAASFIFLFELYYLQNYLLAPGLLFAKLMVRFLSAALFTGLISKLSCDGLARTGVLKNYGIDRSRQEVLIEREEEFLHE